MENVGHLHQISRGVPGSSAYGWNLSKVLMSFAIVDLDLTIANREFANLMSARDGAWLGTGFNRQENLPNKTRLKGEKANAYNLQSN